MLKAGMVRHIPAFFIPIHHPYPVSYYKKIQSFVKKIDRIFTKIQSISEKIKGIFLKIRYIVK